MGLSEGAARTGRRTGGGVIGLGTRRATGDGDGGRGRERTLGDTCFGGSFDERERERDRDLDRACR